MAIRLFLEYENRLIQFPVNPPELSILNEAKSSEVSIVKLGDINVLRGVKLSKLEIESFLPADASPPYVLTKGAFEPPSFYIEFIEKIMRDRKPCRFLVTNTSISMMVSIEEFEYKRVAGSDDIEYSLSLKEYKPYSIKTVKIITPPSAPKPVATTNPPDRSSKPQGFAIGDVVVVNGKYYQDSYGGGRHGTFKNFTGKISHKVTKPGRKLPYHITTLDGGWRGWVALSQLKHK